jgi:hypothetical protein
MPQMAAKGSWVWTGAVVFAGTMLLVVGMINVFEGFIALLDDERVVMTEGNLVIVDMTAWGWILLISGGLMTVAGVGLFTTQTWARITAIVIASLHAIVQIAWLGAYPVWSLLMIALDTIVIFALTARWSGVQESLGGVGEGPWDRREASEAADAAYRTGRITPTA